MQADDHVAECPRERVFLTVSQSGLRRRMGGYLQSGTKVVGGGGNE